MGAARDAYQLILKERIGPALRAEGFKGSGNKYELRGEQYHGVVSFSGSVSNTTDLVRFRVGLVVKRMLPRTNERERPSALLATDGGRAHRTDLDRMPPGTTQPERSSALLRMDRWGAYLADLIPERPGFGWWRLRTGNEPRFPPDAVANRQRRLSKGASPRPLGMSWADGAYDTADPEAVAADVIEALVKYGLPEMRRELARLESWRSRE
jgi:hypothetical protein